MGVVCTIGVEEVDDEEMTGGGTTLDKEAEVVGTTADGVTTTTDVGGTVEGSITSGVVVGSTESGRDGTRDETGNGNEIGPGFGSVLP